MDEKVKKESSVPVQGRISIVQLAELHVYWESQGYEVGNMSKLLSWSVSLLAEILRQNEQLPIQVDSVASAHNYMLEKGLYQRSLEKRSFDKIAAAIRFESLRNEGIDPAQHVRQQYNVLHKKAGKSGKTNSVEVFGGEGVSDKVKQMEEIYKRKEEEDRKAAEEEERKVSDEIYEQVRRKMAEDAAASGEQNSETNENGSAMNSGYDPQYMKEGEVDEEEFAQREREKKEAEDKAHEEFLNSFKGK